MTVGIPPAVLAKEAVYNAVGLCSFDLHGHVDFTPWFHGHLLQARLMSRRNQQASACR